MIPRTKVNYGFRQLLQALFTRERGGEYLIQLRKLLADYFGVRQILLTPSGRSGLYFILRALPQPKVIIPAYTCNAVTEAAVLACKQVVYVEVEPGGFNMDTDRLREVVDAESVVIATHQFGIPCNIHQILKICNDRRAVTPSTTQ